MKTSVMCKVAILAALMCTVGSAIGGKNPPDKPIVIDFQELSTGYVDCPTCDRTGDLFGPLGPTYSSQGYTFYYTPAPGEPNPTGLFLAGPYWPYNVGGTNSL